MLNLIIIPFIILGLYQYRKKNAKLILIIGLGLFLSIMIYLVNLQIKTINEFKAIDSRLNNEIEHCKAEMDSVRHYFPQNEQMKELSFWRMIISAKKYLLYGTKSYYYDANGNPVQYQPSDKETKVWNYKNKMYTGWYVILLYPIFTLLISAIIGILIPVKRNAMVVNNACK